MRAMVLPCLVEEYKIHYEIQVGGFIALFQVLLLGGSQEPWVADNFEVGHCTDLFHLLCEPWRKTNSNET